MRQITALIVLLLVLVLLMAPVAIADDQKPAAAPKEGAVVKLDADEIFALVEQVLKDPKADRAAARAFLQNALDGKVTMTRLEVAVDDGLSFCLTKNCGEKGCKRCSILKMKCFCSNCCIAATQ
jgi:hypothetical protein